MEDLSNTFDGLMMPYDLWHIKIPHWSLIECSRFEVELIKVSTNLPFAEQAVYDRVVAFVQDVIDRARNNEISSEEACKLTEFNSLFTKEEVENMQETRKVQGPMITKFLREKNIQFSQ